MIGLRDLVALAERHADDLDRTVAPLVIGERTFDTDVEPVVMGVVNLSADSSYRESVALSTDTAIRKGRVLAAQGAHLIDLGAESSNVANDRVDAGTQEQSIVPVIEALAADGLVVSIESYAPSTVRAGLVAGARVVNLTGSAEDAAMFDLAAEFGATVVLCHINGSHARNLTSVSASDVVADPFPDMLEQFERRTQDARARGVEHVALDPGVGFGFAVDDLVARARHQTAVMVNSFRLRRLGLPICHSVPHAFPLFEDQFRIAEGFFTVLAHLGGTGVYRTHEVPHVVAVLDAMRELPVGAG